MKRILTILALACMWVVNAHAATANDRYFVAQIVPSTVRGATTTPFKLSVTNDIKSGPNHFLRQIAVTVPTGFTGSGTNGAFTAADIAPAPGWTVLSIAGQNITFVTASSSDQSMTAGKSVTHQITAKSPAGGCPGTASQWVILANQVVGGGNGNTYNLRPKSSYPQVTVSNCSTLTTLSLDPITPPAIITTDASALVTFNATLTNTNTKVGIANEPLDFTVGGESVACLNAPVFTDSLGMASCYYYPQAAPNTPLVANNYDVFAHFAGDNGPNPPLGSSDSNKQQLTVNATGTALAVPPVYGTAGPGNTVTLSATLSNGGSPISSRTISFQLNGVAAGTGTTNASGVASVSGVDISGYAVGDFTDYVGASFAGDGVYSAVNNTGTLHVAGAAQTINFPAISDQLFTASSVQASATASSNLQVSFDSNSPLICTVSNVVLNGTTFVTTATVNFVAVGLCSITASQSGNATYTAATPVTQTFNITNTTATITLGNLLQTYNGGPLSPTVTLPAGLSYSLSGAPQTAAGSYSVTATITTLGYSGSDTKTFIISPATLTVTASSANVNYGDPVPTITPNYGAFQGSDNASAVTTPPTCTTTYTTTSAPADYPTSCSGGVAANYTFSFVPGKITVSKASQTITPAFTLTGTAPGGSVTFVSNTPGVCSVSSSGGAVTFITSGTCTVQATQAGDANYQEVTKSYSITK